MNQRKCNRLRKLIRQCAPEVILKAAGRCDGHSILDPKAFIEAGLPVEVMAHLTTTYRSDGSPKGTIYVNGEAVKELKGVYGLHLLRFVAHALDVEYRDAIGRGLEAQNIQQALRQHFQASSAPAPAGHPPSKAG